MKKVLGLALLMPFIASVESAEVSPECRGLAAGVVSEMKSDNEIADREMMLVAIKAAHRACAALQDGFIIGDVSSSEITSDKEEENMSVWDFLTRKQEKKAGNRRLDRLKN